VYARQYVSALGFAILEENDKKSEVHGFIIGNAQIGIDNRTNYRECLSHVGLFRENYFEILFRRMDDLSYVLTNDFDTR
jgi:hypothetical protein